MASAAGVINDDAMIGHEGQTGLEISAAGENMVTTRTSRPGKKN